MDASKQLEPGKQLKQHLQHQQEPFSLHNYISERSYMFNNNFTSENSLQSPKNLLRMSILRKRLSQAKGILTSILHKFKHDEKSGFSLMKTSLAAASDHNFISTYKSDVGDNKVLSYEHEDSTVINMFQTFTLPKLTRLERSVGDPMFSTFLRKILMTSDIVSMGHNVTNDKQHMIQTKRKKMILQKRKQQLLYNSVEKAKELFFHENIEGQIFPMKAVSELEDLQNIVMHEHFCLLEKQYVEVKKYTHLLHTEPFIIASHEWTNCSNINGEIHIEIGDAIMDDIVTEIIDLFSE